MPIGHSVCWCPNSVRLCRVLDPRTLGSGKRTDDWSGCDSGALRKGWQLARLIGMCSDRRMLSLTSMMSARYSLIIIVVVKGQGTIMVDLFVLVLLAC